MTATAPARLLDTELNEIQRRLRTPLNDDGLRSWYPRDVANLLGETLTLRRDVAQALAILQASPPLAGSGFDGSIVDAAKSLAVTWADQQKGVWQKAEVKRIRDRLDEATAGLAAAAGDLAARDARVRDLEEQVRMLEARVADTEAEATLAVRLANERYAARAVKVRECLARAGAALSE